MLYDTLNALLSTMDLRNCMSDMKNVVMSFHNLKKMCATFYDKKRQIHENSKLK